MENLFEKGCLVQLSVSQWGATRKIDKSKLASMVSASEWLNATKKLVDPEALKPICKLANAARSHLSSISLPFPLQGFLFVPKEMISRVDGKMNEFKAEFNEAVEAFISDYDHLRETAMIYLGDLFNEVDYPVNVRQKFSFAWRFIILDVPNGNTGILAPEVYEREKEKFIQTMEEAREMAIQSLREEFASMLERVTDRFAMGPDGKPKIFKNTAVQGFYDFFETFKERNIFRDEELAQLVTRAREVLGDASPDDVRSDESLRERIRSGMGEVEVVMADILARPRRKIVMD